MTASIEWIPFPDVATSRGNRGRSAALKVRGWIARSRAEDEYTNGAKMEERLEREEEQEEGSVGHNFVLDGMELRTTRKEEEEWEDKRPFLQSNV